MDTRYQLENDARFGVHNKQIKKASINNESTGWYGLAPVSVLAELQNSGIGPRLVIEGLSQLKELGALGCVLLRELEH